MLTFLYNLDNKLVSVSTEYHREGLTRSGICSFAHAEEIAADATKLTNELYIAIDNGDHCYPRYDVIAAPKVGDEVSRSFNGDSYPAGKIVSVSATLKQVKTDTGVIFHRRRQTGVWLNAGTWGLSHGHHNERNPSF